MLFLFFSFDYSDLEYKKKIDSWHVKRKVLKCVLSNEETHLHISPFKKHLKIYF